MGIFTKILNALLKLTFLAIGLSVAVVPLIYIFSHENVSRVGWSSTLLAFEDRAGQVQKIKQNDISNIYLVSQKRKITWEDVNSTLQLADYIQYQLEKQQVTVVKKVLEFKKPAVTKKEKKNNSSVPIQIFQSSSLKESLPLQWIKDQIEPYIEFEHQSLKNKHWIIICLGDLESKFANQIQNLRKSNSLYRFIVISVWPLTSKLIKISTIPYEGQLVLSQTSNQSGSELQKTNQQQRVEEANQPDKNGKEEKQGKKKNDKKYKVKLAKGDKEVKEEKQPKENQTEVEVEL